MEEIKEIQITFSKLKLKLINEGLSDFDLQCKLGILSNLEKLCVLEINSLLS